ncbi:MAG TPA: DUF1304 domain-containing protein [Bdellovibrionales bacterium]|nr:DUF1304 domain-containing protein [Bdellovibrionales bacterium]
MVTLILCGLVAILHVYFLVVEMFLFTTPKGMKIFGTTPEKAEIMRVLAANQGLYNGFLAAGVVWGVAHPNPEMKFQLLLFFLGCVTVAGIYGGFTASRRIMYIQAGPALLAIIALVLGL